MADKVGSGSIPKEYQDFFDGKPVTYPTDIQKKHHIRIKAYEYNAPKIATGTSKSSTDNFKNITSGTSTEVTQAAAETNKKIEEEAKKLIGEGKFGNSTFFTFYTYIPGSFADNTDVSWGKYDTDMLRSLVKKGVSALGSLMSLGDGDDIAKMALHATGRAQVPTDSMIFEEAGTPTLDLTIDFAPRNKDEAIAMLKAINNFRNGTRPTLPDGAWFFKYPPIYDIKICPPSNSDKPITKATFMKYPPMYLKSTNVTYSNGTPTMTFFKDNIPTEAQMVLSFEGVLPAYNGAAYTTGFGIGRFF